MAAIKIIAQTKTRTYPEITTKVIVFALRQRDSQTTLHWVPSHTNIEGNERADALANEATNLTNILPTEQTLVAYKHMIKEFLHKQITPNSDRVKFTTWYKKTIVPGIHLINNKIPDIHICRLRCWVQTKSSVGSNNKVFRPLSNQLSNQLSNRFPSMPTTSYTTSNACTTQPNRHRKSSHHNTHSHGHSTQ